MAVHQAVRMAVHTEDRQALLLRRRLRWIRLPSRLDSEERLSRPPQPPPPQPHHRLATRPTLHLLVIALRPRQLPHRATSPLHGPQKLLLVLAIAVTILQSPCSSMIRSEGSQRGRPLPLLRLQLPPMSVAALHPPPTAALLVPHTAAELWNRKSSTWLALAQGCAMRCATLCRDVM